MGRRFMIFCCVLSTVLPIPACTSAARSARNERKAVESMEALDNQTRLKPGDLISLRLVEAEARGYLYFVSKAGEIDCPFLGLLRVTGLTPRELAFKLKAEFMEKRSQTVQVLVRTADPRNYRCIRSPRHYPIVLVFGAVARQGAHELRDGETLTISALIGKSGGHTSKRSAPKITIIRHTLQGTKRILVNTKASLIEKNNEYDLFLRPYDVMIVE
jgi:protein involved in polysaccharide export with SLBB domain